MAHKTLVSGTGYDISGGKTLVGGTGYGITGGKTLVSGSGYDISFGASVGNLAVGASVYVPVDGVLTEFLVVHQGNPSTSYYKDADGTWLLTKDIYTKSEWCSTTQAKGYSSSTLNKYLKSDFLGLLSSDVQAAILTVRIPWINSSGSLQYGSTNGLSATVFALSLKEVGASITSTSSSVYKEGACLSYFTNATAAIRLAYYQGTATAWWLRSSATFTSNIRPYQVQVDGSTSTSTNWASASTAYGVRPAFILNSETKVNGSGVVIGL